MTSTMTRRETIAAIPLQMTYLRDEQAGLRHLKRPITLTGEVDRKALCVFLSTGMFLGTDTYFRDVRTVRPGEELQLDADQLLLDRKVRFNWADESQYSNDRCDREHLLDQLEALLDAGANALDDGVVLALSGGLDSRSLAAAVHGKEISVRSYSYAFDRGIDELKYGREIGRICGFKHEEFTIPNGYLWNEIDRFPELTDCYAEFTHPRQMAVIDELSALGDTFYLGHWGDVLFDDFGLPNDADIPMVCEMAFARLCKSSGLYLANELWREYGMEGTFESYLRERLNSHLEDVELANANARLRAFKSLHWAPRWTSVNLSVFRAAGRVVAPYYTDEMCELVRDIPARFLEGRQLQIELIKRKSPALADIPWQAWAPFNLYTWQSLLGVPGIPVRAFRRLKKEVRKLLRRPRVRQNWENQFLGAGNAAHLEQWLFETPALEDLVPMRLVRDMHDRFLLSPAANWHAVSMLLTLAVFAKHKDRWIESA